MLRWLMLLIACCFSSMLMAVELEYRNFLGMRFKTVPSGYFYMGSCRKEYVDLATAHSIGKVTPPCPSGGQNDRDATDNELPQHLVRIKNSFQLSLFEVTFEQFSRYLTESKSSMSDEFYTINVQGGRAAVSGVSWNEAQRFILWLNEYKPTEDVGFYRLPSEAEWEYAARAGSRTRFGFGDDQSVLGEYAWYDKNSYDAGEYYAHDVGKKRPNAWGLYDMLGNVWEWTADCWHLNYKDAPSDTRPWLDNCEADERVFRGGAWPLFMRNERVAFRYYSTPNYDNVLGFRLLRELPLRTVKLKTATHSTR